MSCNGGQPRLYQRGQNDAVGGSMYVCNCNGIRERDARAAIEAGARRPADVFKRCQTEARCAKCVCDMRRMIQCADQALRHAAE